MTIRPITLSPQFYEPRETIGGGTVRDAMPDWEGDPVEYVTDGEQYGVRFEDGHVDWLGGLQDWDDWTRGMCGEEFGTFEEEQQVAYDNGSCLVRTV